MFEELKHRARTTPWHALHDFMKLITALWGAGDLTEEQYEYLDTIVRARQRLDRPSAGARAPAAPAERRPRGAWPRSPESVKRRREVPEGFLPWTMRQHFRWGEAKVLAIIAEEVMRHGRCTLFLDKIAALAGYCRTTVQNALRKARRLGYVAVDVRSRRPGRGKPNVITVVCGVWRGWLEQRKRTWRGRGRASKTYTLGRPTRRESQNGVGLAPDNMVRGGLTAAKGLPRGSVARPGPA